MLQFADVPGLLEDRLKNRRRVGTRFAQSSQRIHHLDERGDRVERACGEARGLLCSMEGFVERYSLALGQLLDGGLCAISDASLGNVEDPSQGYLVPRVRYRPQIRQRVPHLTPLVEAHPTNHLVGHPHPNEDLLDGPRLSICSIEDRHITGAVSGIVDQSIDFFADERGLIMFIITHVSDDRLARTFIGPQALLPSR